MTENQILKKMIENSKRNPELRNKLEEYFRLTELLHGFNKMSSSSNIERLIEKTNQKKDKLEIEIVNMECDST